MGGLLYEDWQKGDTVCVLGVTGEETMQNNIRTRKEQKFWSKNASSYDRSIIGKFMKSMGQGVMSGSIQDATEFISALPEFPDLLRMCDLDGNHGFYTMALIDRNTRLRGTICDLPEVVKLAKEVISEMGYSDRIDTIGCDLETDGSIGKGYDLVLVSHVIYSWKGHLEDIFERINEAMVPGGVFVSNHFSMDDDGCGPVSGAMMELMTRLGGYPTHHLSEDELTNALTACGFGGFTVRPAEEGRQYRSLLLAARKLE